MKRFEYRRPRISCDLPVELTVRDSTLSARCTQISKSGMKLEIGQPQEVNSFGKVSVSHQGRRLEVRVRFVHAEETHAGVDFIYLSADDQEAMANLVDSLATLAGVRSRTF
jgi:hypothetical protein